MPESVEHGTHFVVSPGGCLRGRVRVPGDKSISHRALLLASVAAGTTTVDGFLEGEDSLATLAAIRALGVRVERPVTGRLRIEGVGLDGLQPPAAPLDLGNSGTALRLLAGLLCAQRFDTELTGDASLCRRPMQRVTEPLQQMGARIEASSGGTAPLRVCGGGRLRGIDYRMPVASAQVKSAVLLAGLYATGRTCVHEPAVTRDHTERMLEGFGYGVGRTGGRICVDGGGRLQGGRVTVPADISSAAFFIVGALIAPGSDILLEGVGVNPTRTGIIEILRAMGGQIELLGQRRLGTEPIADIRVRSSRLRGVEIDPEQVSLAIDEFPAIFIAAANAVGETVLRGAAELRVKESDRIAVMAAGLRALGIEAVVAPDGLRIRGGSLAGGRVRSAGDHRVAMAFAMAGLRAVAPVLVEDCANVGTSFPGFAPLAHAAGLRIEVGGGVDG